MCKHLSRGKDRWRGLLIAVIHTEVPCCAYEPHGVAGQWRFHFEHFLSSHCPFILTVCRNGGFSMSVSDWSSMTLEFLYFCQINTLCVSSQIHYVQAAKYIMRERPNTLCERPNTLCVSGQIHYVWAAKYIMCERPNTLRVSGQIHYVWAPKYIMCERPNTLCVSGQIHYEWAAKYIMC